MLILKTHWKAVLSFAVLGWGIAYAVAWFRRAECGDLDALPCAISAALRAGADIALFTWMDTTLGAGFLAVIAASAIFINGAIERERTRKDRKADKIEQQLGIMRNAHANFVAIAIECDISFKNPRIEPLLQQANNLGNTLNSDCQPMAFFILGTIVEIRRLLKVGATHDAKGELAALCWIATFLLDNPERYFVTGNFERVTLNFSAEEAKEHHFEYLTGEALSRARKWIVWPE